jgi:subtilisin family serine protease
MLAVPTAAAAEATAWADKVHPRVLEQSAAEGEAEFLIVLDEQADLTPVAALATKDERGRRVFELLREAASRTQEPIVTRLEERGLSYRTYWIANLIWARADLDTIAELALRADVRRLDANPRIRIHLPPRDGRSGASAAPLSVEWGIAKVRADEVWALGYDGSGIVVGGQDTGYDWDHPALRDQYRGWSGLVADHDYNWHDAIHAGGGSCGADSSEPCDDYGHGTHTAGTMVGDDGGANQIGVAPGAKWIGCRNMNQGTGTPAFYIECFQFMIAPTDGAGNNPDPSKAPHVINNSWLCPTSEGCSHDTLLTVVENTRAAGIVVVGSAGNDGNGCSSINAPPAIYDATFTVGATNSSDGIASFSSRGPVTVDGSDRLKPDVSAPGVNVRSCVPGGGYAYYQGTSMAGPHVAGQVALLLDARPDLIGRVEDVETIIRASAVPLTTSQQCGGIPGSQIPNPVYGYGRIDALAAITGDADGDGADNMTDCAPVNGNVWRAPGPAGDLVVARNNLTTGLFWSAPAGAGTGVVRYDVLRAGRPDDFSSPTCLARDTLATVSHDPEPPGAAFYYLVRAKNECGESLGTTSDGTPRAGGTCAALP